MDEDKDKKDKELQCSNLSESILNVLIHEARRNDGKRFLAGLRKPSKLSQRLSSDLSDIYEKRRAIIM